MNITNAEFDKIERAIMLLPYGEEFDALSEEEQEIIVEADRTLVSLLRKKKADNKRTSEAIAAKRKTNPGYARSEKEKKKK